MSLRPVFTSFAGLAAMAVLAACSAQAKQEAAPPPAQVTITAVAFKELRQWDDFTGRLEAVDTVDIRPRVGGYIDGARFEEGARVSKGQVLFQIDARPYQAEANRAAAEVDRAKAQLDLAVVNRERGRRLIEQNALAQSEFDRLSAEEKAAQANVAAASAAYQTAKPEPGMDPRGLADRRPGLQGRDHPRQPGHPGRPADHGGVRHPDLRHLQRRRADLPEVRLRPNAARPAPSIWA
jgi:multidrug efflux pump subunit AcrA (membrane-fusion protein)